MILFAILLLLLIALAIVFIALSAVGGAVGWLLCGDVIVFVAIMVWIIKGIRKNKHGG